MQRHVHTAVPVTSSQLRFLSILWFYALQEEPERLGDVVASLRQLWGLKHIYCWHGLAAYWSGVATGQSPWLNCNFLAFALMLSAGNRIDVVCWQPH